MGYSCTQAADDRLTVLMAYSGTASSNTWKCGDTVFFYEVGDEQPDGAMVGTVYEIAKDPEGTAINHGPFRIDPDGAVVRFPFLNDQMRTKALGLPPIQEHIPLPRRSRNTRWRLSKISSAPIGTEILLYWEGTGHFENGTIYDDGDSEDGRYHVLFDGESLNTEPTHWAPLPAFDLEK